MENEELLERAEAEGTAALETCIEASESAIPDAEAEDFEGTPVPEADAVEEEEPDIILGFTWKQIAIAAAAVAAFFAAIVGIVKLIKSLKK